MSKIHTTAEAATVLKITPRTVQRHIGQGHLAATKYGRDFLIEDAELERFKRERRKPGKPRTKKAPTESRHSVPA